MLEAIGLKKAIHLISGVLEIPAIIVLIIFVLIVVIELGSLIVELILERRVARVNTTKILDDIQGKNVDEVKGIIDKSNFLKKKKAAFNELLSNTQLSHNMSQVLAMRLISSEEMRCQKIVSVTDIIARIAPMFGLMATLIPLGPGLIALGQGDTKMLADSLLTAFDATVAGLAAAGIAFIISRIRKRWYEDDLISMETVMEGVLEEVYAEKQ